MGSGVTPQKLREAIAETMADCVKSYDVADACVALTYCALYAEPDGFDLPALVPQVYVHYDPYTKRQLGNRSGQLKRQRMDFLMLLSQRSRVVLEVDGQQHCATADGAADPVRYAEMAAEDRSLRLAGYEVYRFGAHELTADRAVDGLRTFFRELLTAHHVLPA
ncbi:hypothetical protein SAMN04488074_107341 [Lentzea albidocapillata subsp. violacea]|uniref:DUF559 domain-containing protein n=1 Tax=Lentzea albidocapillata subsp. violacea TaxID=128104 RepID=A0A1G9FFC7_9PSEU|nr:hypothetical protein [Lentzea albidocapillata]SDK87064.1 hypothetical protein SAMN04488074_107341 [Lentzea albidocapillata subsp. violacea]